jgi:hypothetical protein
LHAINSGSLGPGIVFLRAILPSSYISELPLWNPHLFPLSTAIMPTTNDQFDKSFLDADINQLVKQLTMDEKVSLLAGSGWWETVSVPRKNIPR